MKIFEKLKKNTNHYLTKKSRIIYIINRLSENAVFYIYKQRRLDSLNLYIIITKVMKELVEIYKNVNYKINIRLEYNELR